MSDLNNWFNKFPQWIWLSFIPGFGGLSICYAGWKSKCNPWISIGLGITFLSLSFSSIPFLFSLIWIGQIGTAFFIKKNYLIKTAPKGTKIPDKQIAKLISQEKGKLDINKCSKDELVYSLGIPIIYANDIEQVKQEGYIFTDIKELSEIAGIPEHYLNKIEPLITFSYDIHKGEGLSWHKLNTASYEELVLYKIKPIDAEKIIRERNNNGIYKSILDVRKRTGIPIQSYKHLI